MNVVYYVHEACLKINEVLSLFEHSEMEKSEKGLVGGDRYGRRCDK